MKARLYIKPNVVGLQFETPHSRDLFLLSLKHKKVDAAFESFGEKSVRLTPAKATQTMDVQVEVGLHENGVVKVYVEEKNGAAKEKAVPVQVQAEAPKQIEQGVKASDIRPPEPISPLGKLPPEMTGVTAVATQTQVEVIPPPPKPPQIKVPEIAQIAIQENAPVAEDDPKPVGVHHRSKVMLDWQARQKAKQAA